MNSSNLTLREQNRAAALKRGEIVRRKKVFNAILFNFFRYTILFGLCFVILQPIIQQLLLAFRAPSDINDPTVIWIPRAWSVMNFHIGVRILNYWVALGWTAFVTVIVTLLQLVSTGLAGYALSRLRFKGSNIIFILVILTIIVPPQAVSLSQFLYFNRIGMTSGVGPLFLMNGFGMGLRSGIFIFIFKTFFQGLPKELEESAQIDGANSFRIFWNIMLPNARGAIITVSLFAFVWQWNDNYMVAVLSTSTTELPLLTTMLMNMNEGMAMAIRDAGVSHLVGDEVATNPRYIALIANVSAFMIMLPILIAYFFVQKQFVESVERSGIVG